MARPRTPADLRRKPQQERSRAMVERIIAAGQTVLLREGYERASTNRVAQEAGISPGSLYQYFPDKESILAAVIDRYSEELSAQLTGVLADHLDLPGPQLVRATLEALLDVLAENVEFLRLVVEQLPRHQFGDKAAAMEQRIGDLISTYLVLQRSKSRVQDPTTAAWILVRTVEHLTVQYVLETPAIPRDRFVEEIATLILNYVENRS